MADSYCPLASKASGIAEASWSISHARRTLLNQEVYASVPDSKTCIKPESF
jgi:hypothetical protein